VSSAQLHGEGAVVCLAAYEGGSKPREAVLLLAVHEDSGAVVWDARYRDKLCQPGQLQPDNPCIDCVMCLDHLA
jgi:hypothetical protein